MFKYKGFIGKVTIDEDERMLIGSVINLAKDGIDFAGKTVDEAEEDFHGAVDDYLAWSEEEGFEPEKPYQGNFLVRATPELHREAAATSTHLGISLNNFVIDAIKKKLCELITEKRVPDEMMHVSGGLGLQQLAFIGPPNLWACFGSTFATEQSIRPLKLHEFDTVSGIPQPDASVEASGPVATELCFEKISEKEAV